MSCWEEELDIDDSDILLGAFHNSALSKPRVAVEALALPSGQSAARSSPSNPPHDIATDVLKRCLKPPLGPSPLSPNPFRRPAALDDGDDELTIASARKRLRNDTYGDHSIETSGSWNSSMQGTNSRVHEKIADRNYGLESDYGGEGTQSRNSIREPIETTKRGAEGSSRRNYSLECIGSRNRFRLSSGGANSDLEKENLNHGKSATAILNPDRDSERQSINLTVARNNSCNPNASHERNAKSVEFSKEIPGLHYRYGEGRLHSLPLSQGDDRGKAKEATWKSAYKQERQASHHQRNSESLPFRSIPCRPGEDVLSDDRHASPVPLAEPARQSCRVSDGPESHNPSRSLSNDLPYQIPGPAGAVQRGLAQKPDGLVGANRRNNDIQASRKACSIDGTDFSTAPWLIAMDYIEKTSSKISSLSSIKMSRTKNCVPKLVALIKSCSPNGYGDVLVNLKDCSDSIGGTINRRVINETEFGRIIEPGSVMVLHQVAVFSPTPFAHYLNITINNVEQVFAKGAQFSKGECSRAAAKKGIACINPLGRVGENSDDSASHESQVMGEQIMPHWQAECEVHIDEDLDVHISVGHDKTTQRWVQQTQVAEESSSPSAEQHNLLAQPDTREHIDNMCSAPANDGYDQLLDDTDLFECLPIRSSIA